MIGGLLGRHPRGRPAHQNVAGAEAVRQRVWDRAGPCIDKEGVWGGRVVPLNRKFVLVVFKHLGLKVVHWTIQLGEGSARLPCCHVSCLGLIVTLSFGGRNALG